ncbi:uncharacterized protein LOC124174176 [Ischnura elegans]|uniref:uncharacterized protein LOC124174176 n=1 Tax=Ischnura elegans TaxID=197161 RepID=UPI001ED86DBA|nr:uncharacterized protein LOC124174176 [Ischnura elegans]
MVGDIEQAQREECDNMEEDYDDFLENSDEESDCSETCSYYSLDDEASFDENDYKESPPGITVNDKLYEGSAITVLESSIMLISFYLHFKLSNACMDKLLELLSLHLPSGNKMVTSTFKLKSIFKGKTPSFSKMQYCTQCEKLVSNNARDCDTHVKTANALIFYVVAQIKELFLQSDFCSALTHRFHSNRGDDDNLQLCTDGRLYKQFNKYLKGAYDFTFMVYTDGMRLFNSSKITLWPILFVINELPYS